MMSMMSMMIYIGVGSIISTFSQQLHFILHMDARLKPFVDYTIPISTVLSIRYLLLDVDDTDTTTTK